MNADMLSPEFSICRIEFQEDSDGLNYKTIKWGYDSQLSAVNALERIAKEHNIPLDELAVISVVMANDLERFSSVLNR